MLCPICKKREADACTGGFGKKLERLCYVCLSVRIGADMDQAIEAFKHFRDAPAEPLDPGDQSP